MSAMVSICIPAFNQTAFLRRALESIQEQTFKNYEVILCDDSTNEDVEKLAGEFSGSLANLRYHKNPAPLGSPANWNKCMELAGGAIIKFIHHDDWLKGSDALETFVNALSGDKGFAFCDSEILDVPTGNVSYNSPPASFLQQLEKSTLVLFDNNRIGAPTATAFRKTSLRFDENLRYVVDVDFYMRYIKEAGFTYIRRPLIVNTSNHPAQVTAASLGKETQLKEYLYLSSKTLAGALPPLRLAGFFTRLFRKFSVRSAADLSALHIPLPRPAWYYRLLIFVSRIE
jgi:glycosyltransferase involved in cell wall biosynthesis